MSDKQDIKEQVRKKYSQIANSDNNNCGCSQSCCSPSQPAKNNLTQTGYPSDELSSIPEGAKSGLGCGNPILIAGLKSGETVLDLGCGGGIDCFLAAEKVGEKGNVIGIDMTREMIKLARDNAREYNSTNIEFRLGEIEHLPITDNSIDVVISNCVINLSTDKQTVFDEIYRVLKKGGRLAITDIIAATELPEEIKKDLEKYTGCVAGAASLDELETYLINSNFSGIQIDLIGTSKTMIKDWFPGSKAEDFVASAIIKAQKR